MSEHEVVTVQINTGTVPGCVGKCSNPNCKENACFMNVSTAMLKLSYVNYEKRWRWPCNKCNSLRHFEPSDDSTDYLVDMKLYQVQRDPRLVNVSELLTEFFLPYGNCKKICRLYKNLATDKNICFNVLVNGELYEDVQIVGSP